MQLIQYLNEKRYTNFEIIGTTTNYGYITFEIMENGKIHHDHIIFNNKTFEITYITSDIFFMSCNEYRDLFEVEKDELWGIIDAFGNEILPCKYSSIDVDTEGDREPDENTLILACTSDKKYTLFNKKGEAVSKTYDYIDSIHYGGLFKIKNNKKCGVINRNGEVVIKPQYRVMHFAYAVNEATKYIIVAGGSHAEFGVIDLKGNVLIPLKYHTVKYLGNETFFLESNDHKYDIIKL